MDTLQNIRPRLIEPGVKYFLSSSLEQCQLLKNKYYNFLYNLGMFLALSSIVGITLYIKYTHKNNVKLQEEIKQQQQEYIMNKLRFMQDYRKNQVNTPISDLSSWQNNPEVQFYNRKIFS
jgi:hypothetical protein